MGKLVWPVAGFSIGVWLMAQKFEDTGIELDYFRVIGMLSLYACALAWLQMIELVDNTAPTVETFRPISYNLAVERGAAAGGSATRFIYCCSANCWTSVRCRS